MLRRALIATAALIALAGPALAHSFAAGQVKIGHPWALPATGAEGSAFVSLLNSGKDADRLTGASTPVAAKVVIHDLAQGKPTPVDGIDVLPKKPVAMRPTARELRLEGLTRPLKLGDKFPLTLTFAKGGSVTVEVFVEEGPAH